MSKTNKDFWNGPLTGSRIKSEDVKLPEMLIGYFIGPFGALLAPVFLPVSFRIILQMS